MSWSRSAAATAASAASRMTVRIVPSTGLADRAVGRLGAGPQGVGEVETVEAALAAEPLGHPAGRSGW